MDTNQALTILLNNLRNKNKLLTTFMEATKELIKLSNGEDPDAFGALLNKRQQCMSQIDRFDAENKQIVQKLPRGLSEKIAEILHPVGNVTLENPLQTNIFDTNTMNNQLLKRIIDADKELNKKVRG